MYSSGEETLRNDTVRETIYMRRHESGLPVYFCPKPGYQKRYACFATHFGSIDSSFRRDGGPRVDVPDGVAHFLEHKLFEGEDANAFEEFSKNGASSNAYTSFGVTNYLFACGEAFFENLRHLIRFVREPYFTDENVEKEKGIIGQEIRMYEDDPGWRSFFNLLGKLYQKHSIRRDIAGTQASIAEIDKELLYRCYNTFYHPENMILFAVGDEDRDELYDCVAECLSGAGTEPLGKLERFTPEEPPEVAGVERREEMAISMPRLLLGFKDRQVGFGGRELLAKELVTDILLEIAFGKSSDFYQRLYEERLIDDGFGASYSCLIDVGHSMVGGDTPDPERLAAVVLEEAERLRASGVGAGDFERQKRSVMGTFFRQFNSLEFIANHFCSYRFLGINLFDIIDVLHEITVEDLNRRLEEHLVPDAAARSIILPKETPPS
ncbi:MAG: EF-P 5-aminopentanol modification-associated protein YfmH [Planctomycetota bacterium]